MDRARSFKAPVALFQADAQGRPGPRVPFQGCFQGTGGIQGREPVSEARLVRKAWDPGPSLPSPIPLAPGSCGIMVGPWEPLPTAAWEGQVRRSPGLGSPL
jgi:hypothetical protein